MLGRMPYIFLYVDDLTRARRFYEDVLALPVAETDDVASKYDCGGVMLALNEVPGTKVATGPVIVLASPDPDGHRRLTDRVDGTRHDDGSFTLSDPDGHRFRFLRPGAEPVAGGPRVIDVVLPVADLDDARKHYGQVLGLRESGSAASYQVGAFTLSLRAEPFGAPPGGAPGASYVFHASDCAHERDLLMARGLDVGPLGEGDIGVTARFVDPAGYDFYLYEPSAQARSWPSWHVYRRIIDGPEEMR